MTTRARETRRARAARREELRIVLGWLAAVVIGSGLGIGIDRWIHQ
jgi:F0F1-type ATP synthase assembly protein I